MPYEPTVTNRDLAGWCPWDLQVFPSLRPPGDGIYPYPDDAVRRPVFDPCLSACASTHRPSDCCTGPYGDPDVCRPSLYSRRAKAVCPDAYSYAFDDRSSTFIVPRGGGGWEVVFCPEGRSTNIQATFADELHRIAGGGGVVAPPQQAPGGAVDAGFVESKTGGGRGSGSNSGSSSSAAAAEIVALPSRGYVMLCMVVAGVYLILSFG
ncbi:putative thaumatin family protein [Rosellinia necatrix]|uniref:Putative thaumatin family protein n=1 Tax=Rosellinia necatrix TaxID=77044 RepID=A0A1W2TG98_ROSNE|nr:putative thaumatin family protein [Rosellinia necatrix]